MNSLRLFLLVCVTALFLTVGCRDDSSQAPKEGVSLWDQRNKTPEMPQRKGNSDLSNRISKAFQQSIDPEAKNVGQEIFRYVIFLAMLAALVAGLVYWQMRRKKWEEWTLNDPMALVQELNFIHQLSEQEKRVMLELSAKNSLPSPLKLFVEPKFLLDTWDNGSALSRSIVRSLLFKLFAITADDIKGTAKSDKTESDGTDADTMIYNPPSVQT